MHTARKYMAAIATAAILAPGFAFAVSIPQGRALSGDLTITSGTTIDNTVESKIVAYSSAGISSSTVSSVSGFAAGQYVMLIQMVATSTSNLPAYEFQKIQSISANTIFFATPLQNQYGSTGAQIIKVSEYGNVTISAGKWTANDWNSTTGTGGVLVAFLTGALLITGSGTTTAPLGFAGGDASNCTQSGAQRPCFQGNSASSTGSAATAANGMGGGGAQNDNGANVSAGGGGGGNGTVGIVGNNGGSASVGGSAGAIGGNAMLQNGGLLMGGGGGGGDTNNGGVSAGSGGTGSGIVFIVSASTTVSGAIGASILANGTAGASVSNASGGGGAGGSIRLPVRLSITTGTTNISASGGAGGATTVAGGAGGNGRIASVSGITVFGNSSPFMSTSSADSVRNLDQESIIIGLGSFI